MSASRRTGGARARLQFVCTDNVHNDPRERKVLLVWADGSFWMFADGVPGAVGDVHADRIRTRDEWLNNGWRTVVEL